METVPSRIDISYPTPNGNQGGHEATKPLGFRANFGHCHVCCVVSYLPGLTHRSHFEGIFQSTEENYGKLFDSGYDQPWEAPAELSLFPDWRLARRDWRLNLCHFPSLRQVHSG
jgi:hypothetical protein